MMCDFMYMALRHKHLKIDQSKLDRAKQLLKLPTEQETIDRALDAILADEVIVKAHAKLRGVGGIEDVYGGVGTRAAASKAGSSPGRRRAERATSSTRSRKKR